MSPAVTGRNIGLANMVSKKSISKRSTPKLPSVAESVREETNSEKIIKFPTNAITPEQLEKISEPIEIGKKDTNENLTARGKLAGREFLKLYGTFAEVIEASENAVNTLSQIPLGLAKIVQKMYLNVKDPVAKLNAETKAFKTLCEAAELEMLAELGIAETAGMSVTQRLETRPIGRYWIQLKKEILPVFKAGLDLHKSVEIHGVARGLYENHEQVKRGIRQENARRNEERTKKAAADLLKGQNNAPQSGTAQEAKKEEMGVGNAAALPPNVPAVVSEYELKLRQAITSVKFEKEAREQKKLTSETNLTAAIIYRAVQDIRDQANGDYGKDPKKTWQNLRVAAKATEKDLPDVDPHTRTEKEATVADVAAK
jgi:hypothetical protein